MHDLSLIYEGKIVDKGSTSLMPRIGETIKFEFNSGLRVDEKGIITELRVEKIVHDWVNHQILVYMS